MNTRELGKEFYEAFDNYCNQQDSCMRCPLGYKMCQVVSTMIDTLEKGGDE